MHENIVSQMIKYNRKKGQSDGFSSTLSIAFLLRSPTKATVFITHKKKQKNNENQLTNKQKMLHFYGTFK